MVLGLLLSVGGTDGWVVGNGLGTGRVLVVGCLKRSVLLGVFSRDGDNDGRRDGFVVVFGLVLSRDIVLDGFVGLAREGFRGVGVLR